MIRWLTVVLFLPVAAFAASPEELDRLHEALGTEELILILSEEGIMQADELQEEMFPGRGGIGWATTIRGIYAPSKLSATFREAFDAELADESIGAVLDFYASETGARIATLEVDARRAIMSEQVEEAAKAAYADLAAGSERLELLREFAEVNGLIDRNVTGALNSNLAFYQGLGANDAFEMTEEDMLREVWGREPDIRADTEGWVFGYMTFAYETLSDEQLGTYVEMSKSEAGRDLNRALFAGFDAVFLNVSYALGRATGRFSLGDEL